MTKYLVTAALPYANGPIHIGHIAGAYLPADIYARYLKLKGEDVLYICGSDEHGVPITIKAEQENKTPQEIADYYHDLMEKTFENMRIEFDNFSKTSLPIHHKNAQHFFTKLNENGYLIKKTQKQYYCNKCKRFLPDRYVEGTCPHCHYEEARGDQCDNCGKVIDSVSLIEPKCKICGSAPIVKETEHFYLDLSKFSDKLKKWLETKTNWKRNVREFALGWIKEGLQPRAITRDLNWGVKLPIEGYEDKVLYVWFDAPIGYISSTMEYFEKKGNPEKWKDYWFDKNTKLIHFLGKDNIVFHAVIWPSVLMGADEGYILPDEIPANEYLNIEGDKLSTSRNTAIWADDMLREFSADTIRYSIASVFPETKDSDFSWKDFQNRNNSELADIYGNFINRTIVFIQKFNNGKINKDINLIDEDKEFLKLIDQKVKTIGKNIEHFQLRKAVFEFMDIARESNKYFTIQEPWVLNKKDKDRLNTVLYVCMKAVITLIYTGMPFIPDVSKKLIDFLKLENIKWEQISETDIVYEISKEKMSVPFKKIDDKELKKKIESVMNIEKENKKEEKAVNIVEFNEFKKANLIVAKVLEAEKVEKADRLLKLQLDTGKDKRTIVAGIAMFYKPEEIIGKNIIIVENLKPAKIRGIESKGMLLAATNKDKSKLKVIFVDSEMSPGDNVG